MKGFLATLLALAWFAATHALIGWCVSSRPELRLLPGSMEAEKFAHYRRHADDYDLVYVGTSRVLRAFDPAVFEARMAELGRPLCAYNFGLVGMTWLEEREVVDWVLAQRGARLRWLLVEPTEREYLLASANLFTLRDVSWHTPAGTLRALAATSRAELDPAEKLVHARAHLLQGLHRACNIGVAAGLLGRLLAPAAPGARLVAGFEGRDGPAEPQAPHAPEMAAERPLGLEPREPSPLVWQGYRAMTARARAAGLEILYAIPPTSMPLAIFKQAAERGDLAELFVFPLRSFPEILAGQTGYFYDPGHMNARGAALFSGRLAERMSEHIDESLDAR